MLILDLISLLNFLARRAALLILAPYGICVAAYSTSRGWNNGTLWWQEWRDLWFNRPPSQALQTSTFTG